MSLNIDLDIRFLGKKEIEVDYGDRKGKDYRDKVLCFTHAVRAAMKGEEIKVEVGDFSNKRTYCEEC